MVTAREVEAGVFVGKLKEELKKIESIKSPDWMSFAKSGSHRERPPEQPDFWYVRTASMMRRMYMDGPVGVERLKTFYGGRKSRGAKPYKFRQASGNILRKIMQQLEAAKLVEKEGKSGRRLTKEGVKLMDRVALEAKDSAAAN